MWIYMQNEESEWEVGFYTPQAEFIVDSTWKEQGKAREVVHWLNGGNIPEGFPGHAGKVEPQPSKLLNS